MSIFFISVIILFSLCTEVQLLNSRGSRGPRGRLPTFDRFLENFIPANSRRTSFQSSSSAVFPTNIPNAQFFRIPNEDLYEGFGEIELGPQPMIDERQFMHRGTTKPSSLHGARGTASINTEVNMFSVWELENEFFEALVRNPYEIRDTPTKPKERPKNRNVLTKPKKTGVPKEKRIYDHTRELREGEMMNKNYIVRYRNNNARSKQNSERSIRRTLSRNIQKRFKRAATGFRRNPYETLPRGIKPYADDIKPMLNLGMAVLKNVTSRQALEEILEDPNVQYIEEDVPVQLACTEYLREGTDRFYSWGIDRLDNHFSVMEAIRDPNTTDTVNAVEYEEDHSVDDEVAIYVIDTGIYTEHPDFQGRASMIWSKWPDKFTDGHGHGTHVAGIVGGYWTGIARKSYIYGLKAMPDFGNGEISTIIEAIEFVIRDHKTRARRSGKNYAKSIINLSITTSADNPISFVCEEAVREAVKEGIPVVVAAGNNNAKAEDFSPGRIPEAITVGATDYADKMAAFSNYGKAIDILAPGYNIPSTSIPAFFNSPRAPSLSAVSQDLPDVSSNLFSIAYRSGTSQAAPHVAGVLATLLQLFEGQPPPVYILEAYIKYYSWPNAKLTDIHKSARTPNGILATRFCK